MYAEYTGLVFGKNGYMDSDLFIVLLDGLKKFIDEDVNREHHLYSIGKSYLQRKNKNGEYLSQLKSILGHDWKNIRFRNLVRLGADLENAGLGTLSRATLIGALLYQKEKLQRGDTWNTHWK
ncbi:TPA: conjugal transfer protein TraD [Legionella pneumophila]|nr:conjugal transfer protein TraD [Legionella pneumophila]